MKGFAAKTSVLWSVILVLSTSCVAVGVLLQRSSAELHRFHGEFSRLKADMQALESPFQARLRANIAAQEARLAQRDAVIADLRRELATRLPSEPLAGDVSSAAVTNATAKTEDLDHVARLTSRPDLLAIPILDFNESEGVRQRRKRIPRDLPYKLLLTGDADSIINDPEWNPRSRDLAVEERAELASMLHDFRFFEQISRRERVENEILPAVEVMRQQGAYIEYPADSAPPSIEGVAISHAEPSDDPNSMRLYVFYEEDYPDLYHAQTVESQRSLETFVRIYELINNES